MNPPTDRENPDMTKDEFIARFTARMVASAGTTFVEGDDVAEYAAWVAEAAWDEPEQRAEGPEECADADMSYWEEG